MESVEFIVKRGIRTGGIICHTCESNDEGYCTKKGRWCYAVRKQCQAEKDKKAKLLKNKETNGGIV